ncbi:MAG: PKD domain-containing protein, partial [Bacteroidales bacterium]|nr:PKD domain-containing protein [Bacteroidales bacterium]
CGGEVHFAYTDDDDYASLLWDFGDGTSSTDPAPVHSYTANGKYTVSITINYNSTDRPTRIVTQDVFVNNITKKLVIVRE